MTIQEGPLKITQREIICDEERISNGIMGVLLNLKKILE